MGHTVTDPGYWLDEPVTEKKIQGPGLLPMQKIPAVFHGIYADPGIISENKGRNGPTYTRLLPIALIVHTC